MKIRRYMIQVTRQQWVLLQYLNIHSGFSKIFHKIKITNLFPYLYGRMVEG